MALLLESERLVLRPYELKDVPDVQRLANNKALADTTFLPYPYTLEAAENWIETHPKLIEEREVFPFAVILKGEAKLIGTMTLRIDQQHHKGELAYWIGQDYWGGGYATEAAKLVIHFGFQELQLNRIWAPIMSRNNASRGVLQKAGLTYEGTLKQDILRWDRYEDVDVFGLLKADYEQNNKGIGGYEND